LVPGGLHQHFFSQLGVLRLLGDGCQFIQHLFDLAFG